MLQFTHLFIRYFIVIFVVKMKNQKCFLVMYFCHVKNKKKKSSLEALPEKTSSGDVKPRSPSGSRR